MRRISFLISAMTLASLGLTSSVAQRASTPKARYEMDVATMSGMSAMAGRGGLGALGAMMGGGNRVAHLVEMRLGSNAPAAPPPARADHFFLPAAKMGKSVPLFYRETPKEGAPRDFEPPKGRMLLFWGCGARAPKGQPVVIDFSKLAAGQVPANLWTSSIPAVREVSSRNSTSYSQYPNEKEGKMPGKGASLLGEHRIAGNHAPEIKFNMTQDFMPGLVANAGMQADGSVILNWSAIAPATGYVAWALGGMDRGPNGGDVVMWTSSTAREFGGGLWEWLPPETVRNLIARNVVMPPSQTRCQIPAEVKAAAGGFMLTSLNAFGPEMRFSYPPRPADPKQPWIVESTAKVRFRSMTGILVGEGLPGGLGDSREDSTPARKPKPCKGPLGIPIPGTQC
jgi:hypothetical protein